ncbi:MAG: tRNA (N6-threonylcarbamoyladenosine(37)-N6)-methyltransferase TrmO [Ruminococcaceae bacterium]|nr:tRNA (N6-threonylcarbamoyladenosine(37)-N6)-methyltransferase TrmO [Oscillospiraceae bacterium]
MKEFTIIPVAKIKNGYKEKFGIPRQSGLAPQVKSEIIFEKDFRDENLIRDIEQYSHLWLIWGFTENNGEWSPTVRPPKLGGNKRVGVFATRSPYRPNSLGLSVVKLEEIRKSEDGRILVVSGADLLNGTPIFDIKPYLPYVDAIPEANGGFSEEFKNDILKVSIPDEIKNKLNSEDINEITSILELNPKPQYQSDEERIYGLSYKNFEIKFRCSEKEITVIEIE